ncbi:MAG: S-layer homology domain-containing protein [Candidatus Peregrinibacteria bacterium]|nr:S-layer homology domain-containing protein [Candidatus Peregrinibacteria bacterium]
MKLPLLRCTRTWIIAAFFVSVATGVATWSLNGWTASTITNPFQGLTITPSPAIVEAGGTLRLTAEGDFGTATMPVRADWFFLEPESEATGTLEGCERSKTCDFHADDTAGIAVIQAQVGDGDAVAVAKITVTESLKNPFKDELPAWALSSIVNLYRQGIVKGYDDGRYGPADSLTRGQIVTLIVRMLTKANLMKEGEACTRSPSDVPATHYAYAAVCAFANRGWTIPKVNFRPDAVASRGDTAGFLASATLDILEKDGAAGNAQVFDDVPVSSPFFRATALLQRAGIMTGYPSGDFGLHDPLNRAAAATVVDRALDVLHGRAIAHPAAPVGQTGNPSDGTDAGVQNGTFIPSNEPPLVLRPLPPLPRVGEKCPKDGFRFTASSSSASIGDSQSLPRDGVACCEACPSNEYSRYYVPFAGNDCEQGDARRDDLSPKECANPIPEKWGDFPETYGAHCPQSKLRGSLLTGQASGPAGGGEEPPTFPEVDPRDCNAIERKLNEINAAIDNVNNEEIPMKEWALMQAQAALKGAVAERDKAQGTFDFNAHAWVKNAGFTLAPGTNQPLKPGGVPAETSTTIYKRWKVVQDTIEVVRLAEEKIAVAKGELESVHAKVPVLKSQAKTLKTMLDACRSAEAASSSRAAASRSAAMASAEGVTRSRNAPYINLHNLQEVFRAPHDIDPDGCCSKPVEETYRCVYLDVDDDLPVKITMAKEDFTRMIDGMKRTLSIANWISSISDGVIGIIGKLFSDAAIPSAEDTILEAIRWMHEHLNHINSMSIPLRIYVYDVTDVFTPEEPRVCKNVTWQKVRAARVTNAGGWHIGDVSYECPFEFQFEGGGIGCKSPSPEALLEKINYLVRHAKLREAGQASSARTEYKHKEARCPQERPSTTP